MGDNGELGELVEEDEIELPEQFMLRRHEREQKRRAAIGRFIDEKETETVSVIEPRYYGELLAWALQRHIDVEEWKVLKAIGYQYPEPFYIDVNTGSGECQNVLRDGTLFVEKQGKRLAVTVDANLRGYNSIIMTGPAHLREKVHEFANSVQSIVKEQNFYRGKNLELSARVRFLDVPAKTWDGIILDQDTKDEIQANTIGFLANRERLAGYGIPAKRGVLLIGKPGTGKTLVCKALMAGSPGTTCIMAHNYALAEDEYITQLYELAQDLSPCIVFIEDIDLIAQDRVAWGYTRGPALLSLLAVLDGIEECHEIVTVATTNHLETLDKAIGQRPSRFDRIIEIPCPSLEQRKEFISSLCHKIPLDDDIQACIARKTDGFTPAQIQEVLYSLAIRHGQAEQSDEPGCLKVNTEQVNGAISRINGRSKHKIGFPIRDNHHGEYVGARMETQ
jgi:cell division protease FtsH